MDFFEFTSYIIKTKFSNHQDIKIELLKLFYEADSESTQKKFNLNQYKRKETTPGAFFEYTYTPNEKLSAVMGIRADNNNLFICPV